MRKNKSWICDCKKSTIKWVCDESPHPAIDREGWFCMGCLAEFSPVKKEPSKQEKIALAWKLARESKQ